MNKRNYYVVGSILMILGLYSLTPGVTLTTKGIGNIGPTGERIITVTGSIPEHGATYERTPITLQINITSTHPIGMVCYADEVGNYGYDLTLVSGSDTSGVWARTNPMESYEPRTSVIFMFNIITVNLTATTTHSGIYSIVPTSTDDGSVITEKPPITPSFNVFGGTAFLLGGLIIVYAKVKETG